MAKGKNPKELAGRALSESKSRKVSATKSLKSKASGGNSDVFRVTNHTVNGVNYRSKGLHVVETLENKTNWSPENYKKLSNKATTSNVTKNIASSVKSIKSEGAKAKKQPKALMNTVKKNK